MQNFIVEEEVKELSTKEIFLNIGPSHPAMHGVVRIMAQLDGELVKKADIEIGYLHRAFEKSCEDVRWMQCFPYTDRLNYVSPLINNTGFALAVEKLMGIEVPERCKYIRVLMNEISRVTDHLTCIAASAMELGAMSVFLYMIKAREYLYELIESVTGARLTISYCRIGGVKGDLPEGFTEKVKPAFAETRVVLKEVDKLLTKNRIFVDRTRDLGVISKDEAISYGFTGPVLRSTGVYYDVRKFNPYLVYKDLEFEVPLGERGDNYDRYLVRMAEMEQSLRIAEQCLARMPEGPIAAKGYELISPAEMIKKAKMGQTKGLIDVEVEVEPTLGGSQKRQYQAVNAPAKKAMLPPKQQTYSNIEALMSHFKLVMHGHGIKPPKGDVYFPVEGANGELGFYIVSDGGDRPYRVRVRPPCFVLMSGLHRMIEDYMVADIVPTFGSINMIAGELDR